MLVRCIKDADKMYPGWRQLDYYRKLNRIALDKMGSSRIG
jgi:hypothetical protein